MTDDTRHDMGRRYFRSLLFVPGDRPDRFGKAESSGADALILDLEDAVAPDQKTEARSAINQYLRSPRQVTRFVRINALADGHEAQDLDVARSADGIVLPKVVGPSDVAKVRYLLGDKCPPILPIAAETPAALFQLGGFAAQAGLAGLTWGAEDLHGGIRAVSPRDPDGGLIPALELARSMILFAAHAAKVPAIETVYAIINDDNGLSKYATRAMRHGFSGMMAIHPRQIKAIHDAFAPTEGDIIKAKAIIQRFSGSPLAGAMQLEGHMIDNAHLEWAKQITGI